MFAERYLERRFHEGEKAGQAKGEKNTQKRWEAWNRRRVEAEANNEPFNEPPPSLDLKDKQCGRYH